MNEKLQNLVAQANQGDIEAIVALSKYYKNRGEHKKALEYDLLAAKTGHRGAEYAVGVAYSFGVGIEQNVSLGIEYLKRSADKNLAIAQFTLAVVYENIDEAKKYLEKGTSFIYYEKAAKQGHAGAQLSLGEMYIHGKEVKRDLNQAIFWWCCAYLHGRDGTENSSLAREKLNYLLYSRKSDSISKRQIEDMLNIIKEVYPHYTYLDDKRQTT